MATETQTCKVCNCNPIIAGVYCQPCLNGELQDYSDKVQKRHRSFGKREFKGKSPLATSKAYTAVAREGILNQLKIKFPKSNNSLLSEDNIIEE